MKIQILYNYKHYILLCMQKILSTENTKLSQQAYCV